LQVKYPCATVRETREADLKLRNFQKFLAAGLLAFIPVVWAEPVSMLQETSAPFQSVFKSTKNNPRKFKVPQHPARYGIASWYSETDPNINRHTANGEIFDDSRMTCAAWDYPFGTYLEVKNLENGKTVVCRVNDRGPNKRLKRLVDLTKSAFRKIANPRRGLLKVSVRVVAKKTVRKF
jgi:rare lipoprotein A